MYTVSLVILCISAAVLGLELVLIRALSIGHWHHFAYLVISTALLGFASGGTVITVAQGFSRRHYYHCLWFSALGFAVITPATFWVAQYIPFDQLQLIWDPRQLAYLLGYYVLFFIPFFFGGTCICIAFTILAFSTIVCISLTW